MRYSHAIILTVCLVSAFCILFGWFLWTSCRRAILADCAELAYQRDLEASIKAFDQAKAQAESKKGGKGGKEKLAAGGKAREGSKK